MVGRVAITAPFTGAVEGSDTPNSICLAAWQLIKLLCAYLSAASMCFNIMACLGVILLTNKYCLTVNNCYQTFAGGITFVQAICLLAQLVAVVAVFVVIAGVSAFAAE
jgi:hypothetical protein